MDSLARVIWVMREKYPRVLAANRFFEEETVIHNEVGSNNLNDALSHLGTLFEQAPSMSQVEQAHEVHDFEGHLRRSMMESYELIFRQRMGDVAEKWDQHALIARPLQEQEKLHGVTALRELDTLRRRCKNLVDQGRGCKRGHDWDEWERGTAALIDACQTATDLFYRLDYAIAAAQNHLAEQRRFRVNMAVSASIGVAGIVIGAAVALLAG